MEGRLAGEAGTAGEAGEGRAGGLMKLDLSELLRHELARAAEAAAMATAAADREVLLRAQGRSACERLAAECALREEWRQRKEDKVLGGEPLPVGTASGDRLRLQRYMRQAAFAAYRSREDISAELLCLGSWGVESGRGSSLRDLVGLGRKHHAALVALLERRLAAEDGGTGGAEASTARLPGASEKPGNVVKRREQHAMHRLRKMYSVHLIQRAARGLIARRRACKLGKARRIYAWYRLWKRRRDALERLARNGAARRIQKALRQRRLRRRSSGSARESEASYPLSSVVVVQAFARMWLARAAARTKRWEASNSAEAALARSWRRSRAMWSNAPVKRGMSELTQLRVTTERQLIEVQLLKTVEARRCEAQFKQFSRQLAHTLENSKLPQGWVEHEADDDEEDRNAEDSRREDEWRGALRSGDVSLKKSKKKRRRQFLDMSSGQVVSAHPNAHKLVEFKAAERARANVLVETQLKRLDSYAHFLKVEQRMARHACAAHLF